MADVITWPAPNPVMDAVLKAADTMRDSLLIRTIPLGELERFARAVLDAAGVTGESNG